MRLQHGGAYKSDIRSLRAKIRANGTRPNIEVITVSHPLTERTVKLHMNLAYQPNCQGVAINGSLYIVAFQNENHTWHFDIGDIGVPLAGNIFPGRLNGSYASLGYRQVLPDISNLNLSNSIETIFTYNNAARIPDDVKGGMARLIITISEAVRFGTIQCEIDKVLGTHNKREYKVKKNIVNNWGGNILGA